MNKSVNVPLLVIGMVLLWFGGFFVGRSSVDAPTPPPDTQACQVQCAGGSTKVVCANPYIPQCACKPDGDPLSKCVDPANEGE